MAKRGDPSVLRLVVIFLRSHARMTQEQFGKACRVDQAQVSRYEHDEAPSEGVLRRMAKVAGIDWSLVVHLRQFYSSLLTAASRGDAGPAATGPGGRSPVYYGGLGAQSRLPRGAGAQPRLLRGGWGRSPQEKRGGWVGKK